MNELTHKSGILPGNKILRVKDKQVITVKSIDFIDAFGFPVKFEINWKPAHHFVGLPITGHILAKSGFELNGIGAYELTVNGINFMFDTKFNTVEFYLDMVGVDIIYLHQLQNLYALLTGKELEIDL